MVTGAAAERSDLSLRVEARMVAGERGHTIDGIRDADDEAWSYMLCRRFFSDVHRSVSIFCPLLCCAGHWAVTPAACVPSTLVPVLF